jgi:proton-dependent oligopeptide transporter, POT family
VVYRPPVVQQEKSAAQPRRSAGKVLLEMVTVLNNPRFAIFLLVSSGFSILYSQVYNVLPLYLKKVVETNPPLDLYTMANPVVVVSLQLVITRLFGKLRPARSIIVGTVIISLAMLINLVPLFMPNGVRSVVGGFIPLGSLFVVGTVAIIALGELFTTPRILEYIGALSPKGQEGLFLGYANLPTAIGSLIGGPLGAVIFNEVMCHGAQRLPSGLLALKTEYAAAGWMLLAAIGLTTALGVWLYDRWLQGLEAQRAEL